MRAGISSTTVVLGCSASSEHFFTQSLIARPYGGLQKTVCPPPRLFESIVRFSKVAGAFVVGLVGTGVKGEVKLRVKLVEECLRCCPIHSLRREHYIGIHLFHLIVDLLKDSLICDLFVVRDFDFHTISDFDSHLSLFCSKWKKC